MKPSVRLPLLSKRIYSRQTVKIATRYAESTRIEFGHDWIRTSDLFRVKVSIHCTFNILQAAGDCQTTRKYAEGGDLTGDFAGEERIGFLGVSYGGKLHSCVVNLRCNGS